jgi:hypothetical protein
MPNPMGPLFAEDERCNHPIADTSATDCDTCQPIAAGPSPELSLTNESEVQIGPSPS